MQDKAFYDFEGPIYSLGLLNGFNDAGADWVASDPANVEVVVDPDGVNFPSQQSLKIKVSTTNDRTATVPIPGGGRAYPRKARVSARMRIDGNGEGVEVHLRDDNGAATLAMMTVTSSGGDYFISWDSSPTYQVVGALGAWCQIGGEWDFEAGTGVGFATPILFVNVFDYVVDPAFTPDKTFSDIQSTPLDSFRFLTQIGITANSPTYFDDARFAWVERPISPYDLDLKTLTVSVRLDLDNDGSFDTVFSTQEIRGSSTGKLLSVSPVTRSISGQFGGAEISGCTATIANSTATGVDSANDGPDDPYNLQLSKLFDNIDGGEWKNRGMRVTVRARYNDASGYANKGFVLTVWQGTLDDVRLSSDGQVTLTGIATARAKMGDITPTQITPLNAPNAASKALNQYLPIVIGTPSGRAASGPGPVRGHAIDTTNNIVAFAGHEITSFGTIYINDGTGWVAYTPLVAAGGGVIDPSNSTGYPALGTIATIEINGVGLFNPDYDYAAILTGYDENPINAWSLIATEWAGMAQNRFARISEAAADLRSAGVVIATIIDAPTTFEQWTGDLFAAVDADFWIDRFGYFRASWWTREIIQVDEYDERHWLYGVELSFTPEVITGRRGLANKINLSGAYNPIDGNFYLSQIDNDGTSQARLLKTYRILDGNLFVDSAGVAATINDHRLEYRGAALQTATVDMSIEAFPDLDLTQIIGLTYHAGFNAAGGGWQAMPVYIELITIDPMTLRMTLEVTRTTDWSDGYIFHDEMELVLLEGAPGMEISGGIGDDFFTALWGGADLTSLPDGCILWVYDPLSPLFAQLTITGMTTADMYQDTEAAGFIGPQEVFTEVAVPVTFAAPIVTTQRWKIFKSWSQGSAYDKQFGAIALDMTRTRQGTIAAPAGGVTITGTGTYFASGGAGNAVVAGDQLHVKGASPCFAIVTAVVSDTVIKVSNPAPATFSGVGFTIRRGDSTIDGITAKRLI